MKTAADVIERDLQDICASLEDELGEMSGKKILITGGAGFLGYYLVQTLLHWNQQVDSSRRVAVTVYDSFGRGMPEWLASATGTPGLAIEQRDVTQPLPDDAEPFDYIIHAASIASPIYYRKYPLATMDANVIGLRLLLDYASQRSLRGQALDGFLFFSTSEIYGDPDPAHVPTSESYRGSVSCTGPRACYDESKRYGETLCVVFAQDLGVPVAMARPFNNYGPGLKITDRRVLPDFARDVFAERDIRMLSPGSATRTFCYVADAMSGYFKILVRGQPGEAYNIGVEEPEISIADLAERVAGVAGELFGYKGKVVRMTSGDADYLVDNPNRRCPIIRKAREGLGFAPQVALDDGLRRTLLWYRDHQQATED